MLDVLYTDARVVCMITSSFGIDIVNLAHDADRDLPDFAMWRYVIRRWLLSFRCHSERHAHGSLHAARGGALGSDPDRR